MQPRMRMLREHNLSAHDQLYQDSIRRRARAEEYQAWVPDEVTFQPTLVAKSSPARSRQLQTGDAEHSPKTSFFQVISPSHAAHNRLHAHQKRKEVRCFRHKRDP